MKITQVHAQNIDIKDLIMAWKMDSYTRSPTNAAEQSFSDASYNMRRSETRNVDIGNKTHKI